MSVLILMSSGDLLLSLMNKIKGNVKDYRDSFRRIFYVVFFVFSVFLFFFLVEVFLYYPLTSPLSDHHRVHNTPGYSATASTTTTIQSLPSVTRPGGRGSRCPVTPPTPTPLNRIYRNLIFFFAYIQKHFRLDIATIA